MALFNKYSFHDDMTNILCFGDSNTFGTNPSGGRWMLHERWPSVLQDLLGEEYRIVEEGLGGRTTVIEDDLEGDKNGRRHLPMLLRSHRPLDLVILMLGTNDLKHRFSMLPEDIARGAEELGKIVENYDYGSAYPTPRVLLVCPPHLRQGIEHSVFTGFSSDAVETSHQLSLLYRKAAEKHNWLFFDAATVAKASERDKLHMECADHRKLAEALYSLITTNRFPPAFNPVRG